MAAAEKTLLLSQRPQEQAEEPFAGFQCLLLDPPWTERGGGKIKRGADRHYALIKTADMPAVIFGSGLFQPAPNAHLWMWATNNYLPDALWLIGALGFRYVTNAVWVKDRMGLGQYLRGSHELLLFAVRGKGNKVKTERRDIPSVIMGARGKHSAKPEAARTLIEARSYGPRVEFFAREAHEGWTSWGDEVGE